MKKLLLTIASASLPMLMSFPVSAHHMAEGIVADDIYEMIDQNLVDADSPHLDLDLTTLPMDPSEDLEMVILSVTVMEEDVGLVMDAVSDALRGQGYQRESQLDIDISPVDADGTVTITVIEHVGRGQSQLVEMAP